MAPCRALPAAGRASATAACKTSKTQIGLIGQAAVAAAAGRRCREHRRHALHLCFSALGRRLPLACTSATLAIITTQRSESLG